MPLSGERESESISMHACGHINCVKARHGDVSHPAVQSEVKGFIFELQPDIINQNICIREVIEMPSYKSALFKQCDLVFPGGQSQGACHA